MEFYMQIYIFLITEIIDNKNSRKPLQKKYDFGLRLKQSNRCYPSFTSITLHHIMSYYTCEASLRLRTPMVLRALHAPLLRVNHFVPTRIRQDTHAICQHRNLNNIIYRNSTIKRSYIIDNFLRINNLVIHILFFAFQQCIPSIMCKIITGTKKTDLLYIPVNMPLPRNNSQFVSRDRLLSHSI